MPIIYTLIARDRHPLLDCTHPSHTGNFSLIAKKIMHNLPAGEVGKKVTFVFEGHTFNFRSSDRFLFMCMCDEAYGRVKPFQFLKEIMESFNLMFSGEEEQLEGTVARSYSNIILQKMKSYSDPLPSPAIPEKARQVRKELDEVHGVLKNNIEKVISRGEAIDSLVHRSDSLHFSASNFKSSSRKLKQSLCWQEWKLKILIAAIMSLLTVA